MTSNDIPPAPRAGFQHVEPAAEVDFEAFEAVVRSRRSIRIFRDEPVPEAAMQRCLDLALLAPNSSNLQTWEFFWARTPEIRHQLNEACLSQPAVETAAELVFIVARPDKWNESRRRILNHLETQERVPDSYRNYYQKIVPVFYSQGFGSWFGWCKRIGLAIRGLFKPTPREPVHHHEMKTWSVKSASLAAQNLMLALRASGFDSCPLEGFDSRRVKKILGLPHRAVVVMAVAAGKRDPERVYGPRLRFDRELFIREI